MGKSKIIGLCGISGSGKSTVCEMLKNYGFAIIDADKVAREVTKPHEKCLELLANEFGNDIISDDGSLDRRRLGSICFSSKEKTAKLNEITLPCIVERINQKITNLKKEGYEYIVLDAPTLFEAGADKLCDIILAVTADRKLLKKRIMSRDNISEEDAENRLNRAHSVEFLKEHCDYIINNDKTLDELENAVKSAVNFIKQ